MRKMANCSSSNSEIGVQQQQVAGPSTLQRQPMSVAELKALNFTQLSKNQKAEVVIRGRPIPNVAISKECSQGGMCVLNIVYFRKV